MVQPGHVGREGQVGQVGQVGQTHRGADVVLTAHPALVVHLNTPQAVIEMLKRFSNFNEKKLFKMPI